MNKSFAGIALVVLMMFIAAPAQCASPVKTGQKTCTVDADCEVVVYSCDKCCPDLTNTDAVNKQYSKDYEKLGQCTQAHINSCGVPECGLMSPSPVAICEEGVCGAAMRWPNGKPAN